MDGSERDVKLSAQCLTEVVCKFGQLVRKLAVVMEGSCLPFRVRCVTYHGSAVELTKPFLATINVGLSSPKLLSGEGNNNNKVSQRDQDFMETILD